MPASKNFIAIWDVWTRLFHWSLVIAVLFLFFSGETGFKFFDWHKPVGEFVLMLLVFRILWGIVGSSNIRLLQLVRSPADAIRHLRSLFKRQADDERGHNAAGSWAVIFMLILLLVQATTGLFIADEEEFIEGALYTRVSGDVSYFLYTVHYRNATLLQTLVVIHVAMILVYAVIAGKNLLTPMITGRMQWGANQPVPEVHFRPWWIGLLCLFVAVLIVAAVTGWL